MLFTSDNGSYDANLTGGYRGTKGDTYDGGLRVPYIFKWKGEIEPASLSEERIIGVDIYPTLLGLAGIPKPADHTLDGVDVAPLLTGTTERLSSRDFYCFYPKYVRYSDRTQRWAHSWRNVIFSGDYEVVILLDGSRCLTHFPVAFPLGGPNQTIVGEMTLTNAGDSPTTITEINFSGEGSSAFTTGQALPLEVAVGGSVMIGLEFSPSGSSEVFEADLEIVSDDIARSVVAIPLAEKAIDGLVFRLSFDSPNSVVTSAPSTPLVITAIERKNGGTEVDLTFDSVPGLTYAFASGN